MSTREQLTNIMALCNSLLEDLEKETTAVNETGKKINFEQLNNMSKKFLFSNNIVENMSEAYKLSYIKMMIFLVKDVEDIKLQNALLQVLRIATAANVEINVEEELILAYKTDEKSFENMMQDLTRMNVVESQMFIVDVMYMLVSSDICDKEIKEMVGAIFSKLGVREEEMKQLFELIHIIVNRDKGNYNKFCHKDLSIDLRDFYPYTKQLTSGIMSDSKKLCWVNNTIPFEDILALCKEEVEQASIFRKESKKYCFDRECILLQNVKLNISQHIYFSGNEIRLENCEININNFDFDFKNCKKVIFYNCKILNVSRYMNFTECSEVTFDNTIFEGNDSVKCFEMQKGQHMKVNKCTFVNFSTNEKEYYQYGAYFGCFLIKEVSKISFNDSRFKDCRAKHWEKGEADIAVGGIYGTRNINFEKCEFIGCKNRVWQYGSTWKDAGYMFGFDKGVKPDFRSCTFSECVEQIDPYRK